MFISRLNLILYVVVIFNASIIKADIRTDELGKTICLSVMLYNTIRCISTVLVIDTLQREVSRGYKYFIHIIHYYSREILACIFIVMVYISLWSDIMESFILRFLFGVSVGIMIQIIIKQVTKMFIALVSVNVIRKGQG